MTNKNWFLWYKVSFFHKVSTTITLLCQYFHPQPIKVVTIKKCPKLLRIYCRCRVIMRWIRIRLIRYYNVLPFTFHVFIVCIQFAPWQNIVYMHACTHANIHTCMHRYIHTYIMHTYLHTTYMYAYIQTYIHIYIHTYIHASIPYT